MLNNTVTSGSLTVVDHVDTMTASLAYSRIVIAGGPARWTKTLLDGEQEVAHFAGIEVVQSKSPRRGFDGLDVCRWWYAQGQVDAMEGLHFLDSPNFVWEFATVAPRTEDIKSDWREFVEAKRDA